MNKSLYIKYVLEVLKEYSNKENPLNANEISRLVDENYSGGNTKMDYRSVQDKIDILTQLGFVINKTVGGYYFEKRLLDQNEAKLLCDQIIFSSIIPKPRKEKIVKSIIEEFSEVDKNIFLSKLDKSYKTDLLAEQIFADTLSNVNKIMEAIKKDKKLSFKYGNYDENKRLILKDEDYKGSPYDFIYEEGKYYVLMYLDKDEENDDYTTTRRLRIDLMRNLKISNTKRIENPIQESFNDYCSGLVYMYGTDIADIELEVTPVGLRGIYDKMGVTSNVIVNKKSKDTYSIKFKASCSGVKYLALQYVDNMKVIKPIKLKRDIEESLKKGIEKYNKK